MSSNTSAVLVHVCAAAQSANGLKKFVFNQITTENLCPANFPAQEQYAQCTEWEEGSGDGWANSGPAAHFCPRAPLAGQSGHGDIDIKHAMQLSLN